MNWQILVGISLACLIFVIMAAFLKEYRIIFITVLVLFALGSVFLLAAYNHISRSMTVEEVEEAPVSLGQEDCLNLFYGLILAGDYVDARAVLDDAMNYGGYDSSYLLAAARLYVMEENYQGANALYNYLLTQDRFSGDEYIYEECEKGAAVSDANDLVRLNRIVLDNLAGSGSENPCQAAADNLNASRQLVHSVKNGDIGRVEAKGEASRLCDIYDKEEAANPGIFLISALRDSVISAKLLAGEYDRIVEGMGGECSTDQILILSELFRQNKISNRTLQKSDSLKEQINKAKINLEWIRQQKDKNNYQNDELVVIKEAIDELDLMAENPEAAYAEWIKETIREKADGDDEDGKLYLQLSRIAYEEGNEELSQTYLRESFNADNGSEDPAFSGPVNEIKDILEDEGNAEELKKLESLSAMVVDNMGPGIMQDLGLNSADDDTGYSIIVADQIANGDIHQEDGNDVTESQSASETIMIPAAEEKKLGSYTQFVSNQVNKMSASISIASIDASAFEEVSAVIALDKSMAFDQDEFKNNINILDCGLEILDFSVEKIADAKVNIVLCCDTSGSMEGQKIADLRNALNEFSVKADVDTNIGIVSFSGGVNGDWTCQPQNNRSDLNTIINSIAAGGGTSILSGVEHGLSMFTDKTALNVMVVMSDGQDSAPDEETLLRIQTECEDQNVQIYTMGLGADVDADVLSQYSDYGGGRNMFVSDSSSLYSFYEYIYRVSQNRFKITYKALDTIHTARELLAEYKNIRNIRDAKQYYLYEDTGVGAGSTDRLTDKTLPDYQATIGNVVLSGLDTRLLYRSSVPQTINLIGQDLKEDRKISVSLHAGVEYDLKAKYVDDSTWKLTVPARAACGDYDVYVEIDGKRAVFDSGLVIADNNMHTVTFGDYVFAATGIETFDGGNEIKLTGYITMNNWLGLKKEVILSGNPDKTQEISVSWKHGYIDYHLSDNVEGQAKYLAEKRKTFSLPAVDGLKLYRNELLYASAEEFKVDHHEIYDCIIPDLMSIPKANMSLYPDRVEYTFLDLAIQMPFMDKLFGVKDREEILGFNLNTEAKMIADGRKIGADISVKYTSKDTHVLKTLKFGNNDLKVNLGTFDLGINTYTGEGHLELVTTLFMLWKDTGFRVEWKENGLDAILLKMDKDITQVYSGVPVTFSNFSAGVSGLAKVIKEVDISDLELVGGLNISVAKAKAVFPGVEKYIGDVSLVSFDDIEARLRFAGLKATANIKLLGFGVGSAEMQIGSKVSYTNMLLGIDDIEGVGADIRLSPQIKLEFWNSYVEVGGYNELTMLWRKVLGLSCGGHLKSVLKLWVITEDFEGSADMFIGAYEQHNQKAAFGVVISVNGRKVVNAIWAPETNMSSVQI